MEIKIKKFGPKKVGGTEFSSGQIVRLYHNNNSYYAIIPAYLEDYLSLYDPRSQRWTFDSWEMIRDCYTYEIVDTLTFVEE